jgi:hypothetical protein
MMTRPNARVRVCQRQNHKPPRTISSSAVPEMEGNTDTAPGRLATHSPMPTISSMPNPMA